MQNIVKSTPRYLLGLIFLVFGLNGFFNFLPQPPLPEAGLKFIMGLVESGYMMPLVKGIEVVTGVALLAGIFVPLALLLLAPVVVNIFLFHAFLAPGGGGMVVPTLVLALLLITAWQNRSAWEKILSLKL